MLFSVCCKFQENLQNGPIYEGFWAEVWAYRTTPRKLIGGTPFSMTYEVEAVILVEISMTSMRVVGFSLGSNDAQMSENLGFLEER